ncbi:conjugation with cellular fusion- protein [Purpureocillium lavendulum]|uniref:Conjugation with cellular fusion- protein n=1 Tax=Purpureocillium lavendulum TaxID=1247861 RepID=A0AB34FUA9_9HYPO|nr:conjugation with cellular fusion- protein [Purpureocillium lavendulum]
MRNLVLLALVALGNAATVPRGMADGVYAVSLINGREVHTRLSGPVDPAVSDLSVTNEKRDDPKSPYNTYCGCRIQLDVGHTNSAISDIKTQLSNGFKLTGQSVYSIRGDVVAFVCKNPKFQSATLSSGSFGVMIHMVGNACGRYIAGSANYKDQEEGSQTSCNYGIMKMDSKDTDFCGKALTSTLSTCRAGYY